MHDRVPFPLALAGFLVLCSAWAFDARAEERWRWYDGAGGAHLAPSVEAIPEEFRTNAEELPATSPDAASSLPPHLSRPVPASPPASSAAQRAEDERVDRDGNGRAYWQGRVRELRAQISETEQRIEALRTQRKSEPLIRKERQRRADLAEAKEQLEELKRQLAEDLPAEARAAGAPVTWLK